MKNNRILNFLLNVLQVFMQMGVAVCLTNTLLHGFMNYEKFQVGNTLYIGVVIFIYYLAKTCIKNGKLSVMVHLAAAVSVVFVVQGSTEDKILVLLPAILFFSYSMKRKNEHPFLPLDLGIIAACYLVGSSIPAESGTVIPFYCAMIYVVAYFIWYNIKNLNQFVMDNSTVKSFNTEQAVNVNSVMLTIFTLICVMVMFVVPRLHLQDVIRRILLGIWRAFLFGFHALNIKFPEGGYELEQSLMAKPKDDTNELGIMLEMSEGNDVLDLIAAIFAAVIAICMLVLLLKSLKDLRYRKSQGNDVKEFVKPVFRKEGAGNREKKSLFFVNMENDAVVRKLYKSLITRRLKKGSRIDAADTPKEISESVIGWNETVVEITDIYEKARYSEETITKDDVAVLQKARKNLK